ncbi:hypothetical protein HYV50_04385 [Candidatus Pacearchaeota archaeon]|nr:hypothetical protein [Candidatus Pacearchaeota archaeon]
MVKDDASVIMSWIVGIVILLIAIPGLLYFGALIIRPYLIQFTILFAILTILSVVALIIFRDEDFLPYLLIPLGVFALLTALSLGGVAITTDIINSVPNSSDGKASIDLVNDTIQIANVPNEIFETFQTALNQQIEEVCKQYDEQTCQMTKNIVKTYEDTQELQDWINKGNKLIDFVEKHKL